MDQYTGAQSHAELAELDEDTRLRVLLVIEGLRRRGRGEELHPLHQEALAWGNAKLAEAGSPDKL